MPSSDLEALPELLERAGCRRVLIVSGENRRHVERALTTLSSFETAVFAGARQHVPEPVVDQAEQAFRALDADALVALGGGSAIGLAKALRLRHKAYFVAIPTTYAGSEMTTIYGTTRAGVKATGRDPRVRPDAIIYDVALTLGLPRRLTITSLMNALAHPLGVLGAGQLDGAERERALTAAELVFRCLRALLKDPGDCDARRDALRAAGLAAQALEAGKPGLHHQHVHRLGGRFDLEHSALHSVLLPHSVERLRRAEPALLAELERRLGTSELGRQLFDALALAGAPTSLAGLGIAEQHWHDFLRAEPIESHDLLSAAYAGTRPGADPGARPD